MRTKLCFFAALLLLWTAFTLPSEASASLNVAEAAALADFVAGEAGGESYAVQLALAATLLNQLSDPRYPDTVSGVLTLAGYRCRKAGALPDSARSAVWAASEGLDVTEGATAFARVGSAEAARIQVHFTFGDFVFGRE